MRYVFVSYNYSPSFDSPESWFKRTKGYSGVLECLAKDNTVINIKQINYEGNSLHKGVQYLFVNFGRKKNYFPHRLNRLVKLLGPDIVIVQGLHHPLQVMQLRMVLPKNTKIIAQHHAEKPFAGIKKYVQRLADACIDAYLFASAALGADWVKNGNIASQKKIHEVMEVSSRFYPVGKEEAKHTTAATGDPIFLWVGRLNNNKDPLMVVRAFLSFVKTCPGARLYMFYHTDELLMDIQNLLKNETDKNAIRLMGNCPHADLLYWFNAADFFISGSWYEGSGTAMCEAMSCGCIPVVTNIPSFRMMTNNGVIGLLYEAGNEQALLSALFQTQQLDLTQQREASLARFHRQLSFEAIACKIITIASRL